MSGKHLDGGSHQLFSPLLGTQALSPSSFCHLTLTSIPSGRDYYPAHEGGDSHHFETHPGRERPGRCRLDDVGDHQDRGDDQDGDAGAAISPADGPHPHLEQHGEKRHDDRMNPGAGRRFFGSSRRQQPEQYHGDD